MSPGAGGSAGDGGRHRGEPGPAGGRAAAAALGPLAGGGGGGGGPGELREPPSPQHRPAVAPGPRRLGHAGGLAGPRAAAAAGGGPGRRAVARLLRHLGRPGRAQHHRGGHPERLRPGRGRAGARGGAGPRRGAAGAAVGAGGAGGGPAAAAAAGAAAGPAAAGAALPEALLLPGSLPPRGGRRGQQPHGAGGDAAGALGALPAAGGRRGAAPRPRSAAGSRRPQPGVEGGGAVPLAQVGGGPEPAGGVRGEQCGGGCAAPLPPHPRVGPPAACAPPTPLAPSATPRVAGDPGGQAPSRQPPSRCPPKLGSRSPCPPLSAFTEPTLLCPPGGTPAAPSPFCPPRSRGGSLSVHPSASGGGCGVRRGPQRWVPPPPWDSGRAPRCRLGFAAAC